MFGYQVKTNGGKEEIKEPEEQISDSPLVIPAIFLLLFWTNLSIDVDILRMIKLNWKIYL